jgi:hypothetical protein
MKYWTFCNLPTTWDRDWYFNVSVASPDLAKDLHFDVVVYQFAIGKPLPASTTARVSLLRNPPEKTNPIILSEGILATREICENLVRAFPDCLQMFAVECEHPVFDGYACLNVTQTCDCMDMERSEYVCQQAYPGEPCAVFQFWFHEDRIPRTGMIMRLRRPRGFLVLDELARSRMIDCGVGEEYFSDLQFRDYNRMGQRGDE